jgi:hypothetical protein
LLCTVNLPGIYNTLALSDSYLSYHGYDGVWYLRDVREQHILLPRLACISGVPREYYGAPSYDGQEVSYIMSNDKMFMNDLVGIRSETLGTNPNICLEDEKTQQVSPKPIIKLKNGLLHSKFLGFRSSEVNHLKPNGNFTYDQV